MVGGLVKAPTSFDPDPRTRIDRSCCARDGMAIEWLWYGKSAPESALGLGNITVVSLKLLSLS